MGNLGNSIQTTVNNIVDNPNFRTPVIVIVRTPTIGAYGGFDAVNDNTSISETVNAVPYNLIQPNLELHQSGPIEPGSVQMVFRSDASLDSAAEVTFNGGTWEVRQLEPIVFNEVTVAVVGTFSPKL